MNEMTFQQKAMALRSLDPDFRVQLRQGGGWYASVAAETLAGGYLTKPTVSEPTPNDAVCALFDIYAEPGTLVVLNALRDSRRQVTWTGYMWSDVP